MFVDRVEKNWSIEMRFSSILLRRFLSMIIDSAIILSVLIAALIPLLLSELPWSPVLDITFLVFVVLYFVVSELKLQGQTLGKVIVGIARQNISGQPLNSYSSTLRIVLLTLIPMVLVFVTDFLMALWYLQDSLRIYLQFIVAIVGFLFWPVSVLATNGKSSLYDSLASTCIVLKADYKKAQVNESKLSVVTITLVLSIVATLPSRYYFKAFDHIKKLSLQGRSYLAAEVVGNEDSSESTLLYLELPMIMYNYETYIAGKVVWQFRQCNDSYDKYKFLYAPQPIVPDSIPSIAHPIPYCPEILIPVTVKGFFSDDFHSVFENGLALNANSLIPPNNNGHLLFRTTYKLEYKISVFSLSFSRIRVSIFEYLDNAYVYQGSMQPDSWFIASINLSPQSSWEPY